MVKRFGSIAIAVGLTVVLGAAGCSSSGTSSDASSTTAGAGSPTTSGSTPGTATTPGTPSGTTPGSPSGTTPGTTATGDCPGETELTVSGSSSIDGPLEIETEFADVTLGASASLVFATYEIPEDPQFGPSAPVGVPEVPAGGVIFQVSLTVSDGAELAPGEYPDDDSAPARINFISMYEGSTRVNPLGDHTVTITSIDDTQICGTITAVGDTALQSFPVVEGSFVIPVV